MLPAVARTSSSTSRWRFLHHRESFLRVSPVLPTRLNLNPLIIMNAAPIRRFLVPIALVLSAGFACGAETKIGLLLKARGDFWSAMEKGATEAGRAAGAEIVVKAPISEADVGVQMKLLDALAAQGIQALVIAPTNKDALAGPVAALAAKGVKIVVVDSPLAGTVEHVFVGTNQRAAGEAAGQLLATMVQAKDEITLLKHYQGSGATEEREIGAIAKLREAYPGLVMHGDIYSGTEKGAEEQKAELALTKYPNSKVILASSTPGTMAMLKVIQQKGLAGKIKLVGFGFNLNPEVAAAIESGAMTGWIAQLPKEVGRKGVEAAVALLKGQAVPAVVNTDFLVVTKDNLKDPKVQALLSL
jgi:ribose transport system substrate-binding protein